MHDDQYPIVAARRQGYDNLLWQVPALGIAAQSFLVAGALNGTTVEILKVGLLVLGSVVGLSVFWLFRKLRFHEVADSELLKNHEKAKANEGFEVVHGRRGNGWSAYSVWRALLFGFASVEFAAGLVILIGPNSN